LMRNSRDIFKTRQPMRAYETSTRTHGPVWSRRLDDKTTRLT
jgi:hypothetical protein